MAKKLLRFLESENELLLEGWDDKPNEIRHRLKDPGGYDTCRSKDITAGVRMILCKKKGTDTWEAQALRFDKEKFDMASAKAWVEKHKDSFKEALDYEPAGEECVPLDIFESSGESAEPFEFTETATLGKPDATGEKWEIALFKFGESKRPPHFVYTREAIQKSRAVLEAIPVYANSVADDFGHKKTNEKVVRDKVGIITDVHETEVEALGTLHWLPSGFWLRDNLSFTEQKNLPKPYELSIDASGTARQADYNGNKRPHVESFARMALDVVEKGAAGGRFVRMVASHNQQQGETLMNKEQLIALLKESFAGFVTAKKIDFEASTDEQLVVLLKEAATWKPEPPKPKKEDPPKVELDVEQFEALKESANANAEKLAEMELRYCASILEAALTESRLPKVLQENLRADFKDKVFDRKDLDVSIKRTRETYAKLTEGMPVSHGLDIRGGMDSHDKARLGIEAFFMLSPNRPQPQKDEKELRESYKTTPPYRSIRQAYVDYTGDVDVTGLKDPSARMSESLLTSDFAQVVADALNKRMVRDYPLLGLDSWREWVDIVPLKDFKTQHVIRYGGYGNLPTRPERGAYQPLTSPTDEEATYVALTKGGTEDLTRELIMNDDVGAVSKIPQRMVKAAAQTLHEYVYEFITVATNATVYDSVALYYARSAGTNFNNTALGTDGSGPAAARLAMAKYADMSSAKRLGIRMGMICVPPDLEASAYTGITLAYGVYNNVPTFVQAQQYKVIVVPYWTDAADYVCIARREDVVGMELGFINGQEMPEIMVSDLLNAGGWFTNDVITYKIRHQYGGAITDWRAFFAATMT